MPVILILAMLWLVGLVWTLWAVEFFRHHQGRFPDFDPDTVLYRRLLEQSIDRGRPVKIDTYQNFPNGVSLQFPPFYLKILLWTVWGFFALFPRASIDPELIAGTLPVIAFVGMNALILWRIWRKTRNLAVASLVAFGALPGFPQNTVFRFIGIDHHWLEVSCIWLIILMAAEFEESRWDGWKVGGGICTALFIGVWMGSPLWHAILAAYATVLCLFGAREPARAFAEFAASSMLIGGALMCIHGIWYPPTQGYWIMHQYSWLQPSLAVGAGMWCHLLHGLLSRGLVKHLWVFVGLGVLLVGGGHGPRSRPGVYGSHQLSFPQEFPYFNHLGNGAFHALVRQNNHSEQVVAIPL